MTMTVLEQYGNLAGFFLLFMLVLSPRLTLLYSVMVGSISVGMVFAPLHLHGLIGVLLRLDPTTVWWVAWWIAWLIVPRFLIAILATVLLNEADQNLVLCAWFLAMFMFYIQCDIARDIVKKVRGLREERARRKRKTEEEARKLRQVFDTIEARMQEGVVSDQSLEEEILDLMGEAFPEVFTPEDIRAHKEQLRRVGRNKYHET